MENSINLRNINLPIDGKLIRCEDKNDKVTIWKNADSQIFNTHSDLKFNYRPKSYSIFCTYYENEIRYYVFIKDFWHELLKYPSIGFRFYPKTQEEFDKNNEQELLARESIKKDYKGAPGINFPISQKIAAGTIGSNLLSVQPISAPIGDLFYFDFVYQTQKQLLVDTETDNKILGEDPNDSFFIMPLPEKESLVDKIIEKFRKWKM